jgi:hypothetical protein
MAYTFDSLGYAKRLRDGGVPQDQAEAHAEAARDFMMPELATKADVLAIKTDLLATEQRLGTEFRTGIGELQTELRTGIAELQTELHTSVAELRTSVSEVRTSNETLALRLTVRLGTVIVVGFGVLAAILKIA